MRFVKKCAPCLRDGRFGACLRPFDMWAVRFQMGLLSLVPPQAAGRTEAVRSVRRAKNKERTRERFRKEVVSPFGFVISRNICGYQLTASYRSIIFDSISFS